jgi:endonuclease YncB( thermonuclease family)
MRSFPVSRRLSHRRRRFTPSRRLRHLVPAIVPAGAIVFALTAFAVRPVPIPETAGASTAGAAITGRASVIDGDTIEIHGRRIRLHGVDTPEMGQVCRDGRGAAYACGRTASSALASRIGWATVSCVGTDTDRYGRTVAICRAGTTDLGAWLVAEGHGLAFRRYGSDYVSEEDEARRHRRGLWAGDFTPPWEWRRLR